MRGAKPTDLTRQEQMNARNPRLLASATAPNNAELLKQKAKREGGRKKATNKFGVVRLLAKSFFSRGGM